MIHVKEQPEPECFDELVRIPGKEFLKKVLHPTKEQWKSHAYWGKVKDRLYNSYDQICSYSCHWIPADTGFRTCEHFIAKESQPELAYEWSNYRLVCGTLNGRKGNRANVLDPFHVEDGWFIIDFPSLIVQAESTLADDLRQRVKDTIRALKLNDEGTCLKARFAWLEQYCVLWRQTSSDVALPNLQRYAPFLARELLRQNLVETIADVMGI